MDYTKLSGRMPQKSEDIAVRISEVNRQQRVAPEVECGLVSQKQGSSNLGGPGTEMERIMRGVFKGIGCECRTYARQMDRWGVGGCEARFGTIVDHLVGKASSRPDVNHLEVFQIATHWVQQAIDRAKATASARGEKSLNGYWFVAVTTAPRKSCTLLQCIKSLRAAGWEPTVFAEPGSTTSDAETIWNATKLGVWHNWLTSAKYALEKTDAEVILTVQDDSRFHPDSRVYTESILWPAENTGFISLYTPKHYSIEPRNKTSLRPVGVNRVVTRSLWGACALVWPRQVLEAVVHSKTATEWVGVKPRNGSAAVLQRRRENPSLIANSDTAIGRIVNRMERSMWFVDPSPVRHIAKHSTISHGGNDGRRNCYRCADHAVPLAELAPPPQAFAIKL